MSTLPTPSQHHVRGLYEAHHSWLQGWLRRRLGNECDAADLAQDTFVRLLRHDARRASEGVLPETIREPRAYLSTVAHGLMVSHIRRKALERAYVEALAVLPEAQAISPEQQLSILQTLQEVDAMLSSLKPRVKTVFLMAQIDGLKQQEIASQLGISVPTVKKYMQQAWLACLSLMVDD